MSYQFPEPALRDADRHAAAHASHDERAENLFCDYTAHPQLVVAEVGAADRDALLLALLGALASPQHPGETMSAYWQRVGHLALEVRDSRLGDIAWREAA